MNISIFCNEYQLLNFREIQNNGYKKNTLIIWICIFFIVKHVTKIPEKEKANGQKPSTMSMNSVMTMVIRYKFFQVFVILLLLHLSWLLYQVKGRRYIRNWHRKISCCDQDYIWSEIERTCALAWKKKLTRYSSWF